MIISVNECLCLMITSVKQMLSVLICVKKFLYNYKQLIIIREKHTGENRRTGPGFGVERLLHCRTVRDDDDMPRPPGFTPIGLKW